MPNMPQGCAGGLFDRDGREDLLGTLNLLTPSVVKAACAEAARRRLHLAELHLSSTGASSSSRCDSVSRWLAYNGREGKQEERDQDRDRDRQRRQTHLPLLLLLPPLFDPLDRHAITVAELEAAVRRVMVRVRARVRARAGRTATATATAVVGRRTYMPIGKLRDLAALSAHCKKSGRYSFMLT
ncbi:hypothetical protein GGR56DRAFT_670518 [Xylariaceae sp. FL0804]|nr:hypothetical protein GGR56DRAFT_670518 [Xylariaceae sp. FL0804]